MAKTKKEDVTEYEELVAVPAERVEYFGKNLAQLGRKLNLSLALDEDGVLHAKGQSVDLFFGKNVLNAVALGFPVKNALRLQLEDQALVVADVSESVPRQGVERTVGRIIGEGGKAKELLEELGDCKIEITGPKIGIICRYEMREPLEKAVSMLINGAKHGHVYSFLEKCRRNQKLESVLHPYK